MKINNNTSKFWDLMNIQNKNKLFTSPIYIHKNKIISKWITGKNKKLLNIGIGNGYLEHKISLQNNDIKLYGIDISKLTIKIINKKIEGNFKVANIKNIPFKNNLFDFVLAIDIFEHLTYRELHIGINEINRVIINGGKLIISIPLNEILIDKELNRHMISFTLRKLSKLLIKNSFNINKYKYLYAFKNLYSIKSFLTKYLHFRKPNLLIIEAIKI
ncbi:MAG: methyltransferase domain-containing protein [bacterium]|nr:methyltransferase domain-containing protein [bacterium]